MACLVHGYSDVGWKSAEKQDVDYGPTYEAAPEATESLTPQAGRPLVDELDLVDSQRGLKCAICALHNLLQQRRFSDAEARLAAVHVECKSMTGMYNRK